MRVSTNPEVVVRQRIVHARQRAAQDTLGLVETSQVAEAAADLTEHLIVAGHHLLIALKQLERFVVAASVRVMKPSL